MAVYLDCVIVLLSLLYVLRCTYMNYKYETAVKHITKHPAIGELIKLSKRLVIFSCIISIIFLGINAWRSVVLFKQLGAWGISAIIILVYFNIFALYQLCLYHWYHNLLKFARYKDI